MTNKNLRQIVVDDGDFSSLNRVIDQSGLADFLADDGPYTVFAPTDEAFGNISEEKIKELFGDNEALANIVNHHIVAGEFSAADLGDLDIVETIDGAILDVAKRDGTITIDRAEIIRPDVEASNGVIHAIDRVLQP